MRRTTRHQPDALPEGCGSAISRARSRWRAVLLAAPVLLFWASLAAQQHAGSTTAEEIEAGARLYAAQCAGCHGPDGNLIVGVDLRRGVFRLGSTDEDLARTITQGIPGTAMIAHKFSAAELSALLAYIRSMSTGGLDGAPAAFASGDPSRGRLLFEGEGKCLSCHRVYGNGSRQAANLSDIGALRSAAELDGALRDPAPAVPAGRRLVRARTADGRLVTGRRLNEDTFTVQLLDDRERLVSLVKAELREYSVSTELPVAPHTFTLSDEDRRDLVTFLLSLKGLDPIPSRGAPR